MDDMEAIRELRKLRNKREINLFKIATVLSLILALAMAVLFIRSSRITGLAVSEREDYTCFLESQYLSCKVISYEGNHLRMEFSAIGQGLIIDDIFVGQCRSHPAVPVAPQRNAEAVVECGKLGVSTYVTINSRLDSDNRTSAIKGRINYIG